LAEWIHKLKINSIQYKIVIGAIYREFSKFCVVLVSSVFPPIVLGPSHFYFFLFYFLGVYLFGHSTSSALELSLGISIVLDSIPG
jgi:hypothetical protein